MKRRPLLVAVVAILAGFNADGWSQGFIIPSDTAATMPVLISNHVMIEIKELVSAVQVDQEFSNSSERTIEGLYYFPIPHETTVSDLSFTVDGKGSQGELFEKEAASLLYDKILRRQIDPALLEMVGHDFFRVKLDPVLAKQDIKISLRYQQILKNNDGMVRLLHPFRGKWAYESPILLEDNAHAYKELPAVNEEIVITISSTTAIKNIYSPTHKIDVVRKHDTYAQVYYGGERTAWAAADFVLYYGLDDVDIGLNLLAYREDGRDGYFMILLSPKVRIPNHEILRKDLILVLDVSASMVGEKLGQAKDALRFCISSLGNNDNFNIIVFSTEAKLFKRGLVNAGQFRYEALDFINRLEAKGGTNINESLLTALDMQSGRSQSPKIVFITDGLPTVGVKDADEIRRNVKRLNRQRYRIFTFGVGYDVNTQLLDGIAQDSRAVADYIEPAEDIETAISTFYNTISDPVLSSPQLDYGSNEVEEIYPRDLPDLFKGSQLTIIGRYKNTGPSEIKLTGSLNEATRSFKYQVSLPQNADEIQQIPQLWATRKIGFLLEQIKVNHGQGNQSLIDEIVDLSRAYGIMTPYTSVFVNESNFPQLTQIYHEPDDANGSDNTSVLYSVLKASVGKPAVSYSKTSRKLQEVERLGDKNFPGIRYAGGRSFVYDSGGYWQDLEYGESEGTVHIKYRSEAYFRLLKEYPKTARYLSLGPKIIFRFNNKFVQIDEKGLQEPPENGIKELFKNTY